jgi:hypothetical protein
MRFRRFKGICLFSLMLVFVVTFSHPVRAQKGGGASPGQPQGAAQQGAPGAGATPYFETIMEAYGATNELSRTIAREVCAKIGNASKTVVIFDPVSFQNVAAWQSFSSTSMALKNAYETLLTQAEVDGLFPPPAAPQENTLASIPITSASDLAGLITALASSTTNTASTFTIQDSSMAVSLAHQFQRISTCKVDLKYFPLFGSYVDFTDTDAYVQQALEDLNRLRRYIQHNAAFTGSSTSVQYLLFSDLNNQYDQLLKTISSSPTQGGQSGPGGLQNGQGAGQTTPAGGGSQQTGASTATGSGAGLVSLEQGAALNTLLSDNDTYVLYADVVAAGGTQRDRKNILTLITGDWISYSGGAIVNVALVHSKDTSLELADTLRYRSAFARHLSSPKEYSNIENTNAGENEPSICGQETRLHWWQRRKTVQNPCPSANPE